MADPKKRKVVQAVYRIVLVQRRLQAALGCCIGGTAGRVVGGLRDSGRPPAIESFDPRPRLRDRWIRQLASIVLPQRLHDSAAVQGLRVALTQNTDHRCEVAPGRLRSGPVVLNAGRGLVDLAQYIASVSG